MAFGRFPEVRPVGDCRGPSRAECVSPAQTGKTVVGPGAPRPVRTSRIPVRLNPALGGQDLKERCPARVMQCPGGRQVATGGSRSSKRAATRKELAVNQAAKKEPVTALNGVFKGTSVLAEA